MKPNTTNLLIAAAIEAEYALRTIARMTAYSSDAHKHATSAAAAIRARVEHATEWTWEALEGDEDLQLLAGDEWSRDIGDEHVPGGVHR